MRRQRCTCCLQLTETTDTFTDPNTGRRVFRVCPDCSDTIRNAERPALQTERLPLIWPNP